MSKENNEVVRFQVDSNSEIEKDVQLSESSSLDQHRAASEEQALVALTLNDKYGADGVELMQEDHRYLVPHSDNQVEQISFLSADQLTVSRQLQEAETDEVSLETTFAYHSRPSAMPAQLWNWSPTVFTGPTIRPSINPSLTDNTPAPSSDRHPLTNPTLRPVRSRSPSFQPSTAPNNPPIAPQQSATSSPSVTPTAYPTRRRRHPTHAPSAAPSGPPIAPQQSATSSPSVTPT
eukprot:gene27283-33980_t